MIKLKIKPLLQYLTLLSYLGTANTTALAYGPLFGGIKVAYVMAYKFFIDPEGQQFTIEPNSIVKINCGLDETIFKQQQLIEKIDEANKFFEYPEVESFPGFFRTDHKIERKKGYNLYETSCITSNRSHRLINLTVNYLFRDPNDSSSPYASNVLLSDLALISEKLNSDKVLTPERITHIDICNRRSLKIIDKLLERGNYHFLNHEHNEREFNLLINTKGTNGITTKRLIRDLNILNSSNFKISKIEIFATWGGIDLVFHIKDIQDR